MVFSPAAANADMKSGKYGRRNRRAASDAPLEMSAMIDVVFLLLIFFIATMRPADVFAQLETSRPAPPVKKIVEEVELMRIDVLNGSYLLNRKHVDLTRMEEVMRRVPVSARDRNVIITCHMDSSHSRLIKALDLCSKLEFKNLSLVSR